MWFFFIMTNELPELNPEIFDQPSEAVDPLYLELDDESLVKVIKDSIKKTVASNTKNKLYARQAKNLEYYLGKQQLYKASNKAKPYKENIIYEGISRQKPIALSRMPDLTVKPGNDTPESKMSAEKLSGIFNSDTKKRDNRKLLGLSFKLEPLYFFAVVKAIWNAEKGKFGDYEYVSVHPDDIVWDDDAVSNDTNKMRFIAEKAQITIKEMIMTFPDKEEEIKAEFNWTENEASEESKLATSVKMWEVWFHWYKLSGKVSERVDGTMWMYGNTLLDKMRNPYFDYQGKKKTFSKVMKEKESYTEDQIFQMFDVQAGREEDEVVYNNYFQDPQKPYFFMVYENMGKSAISATSRVEQSLEFQDCINQDGSIIQDMNIRSRGKDIFDTNAIDQTVLDTINIYDIDQVLGLNLPAGSSMNNAHARIEQSPATAQQYNSMNQNRQKGFEMLGVKAANRGIADSDLTLGQEQMGREGDFTLTDDIVEETINACAEWQSDWALQFIKLFYTKPHMRHILGKDGDVLHTRLTQDLVEDGMEVVVSASGVDKTLRKRTAIENAKLGFADPLTFFEDTEQSNPKERAKRAMLVQLAPQMYIQEYLMDDQPQDPNTPATNAVLSPDNPEIPPAAPAAPQAAPSPMGGGSPAADPLDLFK